MALQGLNLTQRHFVSNLQIWSAQPSKVMDKKIYGMVVSGYAKVGVLGVGFGFLAYLIGAPLRASVLAFIFPIAGLTLVLAYLFANHFIQTRKLKKHG